MPLQIPQSVAKRVMLKAYLTDGITEATGKTIAVTISKNGGAFGNPSAGATNATEVSAGWYYVTLSTTDTNTLGPLVVRGTASGVDPTESLLEVIVDVADAVWDEVLTGATHNVSNSAGRRLRQLSLAGGVIYEGTVVSATANTVVLDNGADSTNGAYDPAQISITDGTGNGQTRLVLEYVGATRTCVLDRDWKVTPSGGDGFIIFGNPGREHVNEGLIRAGTTYTCQLNANASTVDDNYVGQVIFIRSGTGQDQARRITDYDGATQTAVTRKAWNPVLDATSAYVMLPTAELDVDKIYAGTADAVWDEVLSGHGATGSAGKVLDDAAATGDAMTLTAAYDNAKTAASTTTVNAVPAGVWAYGTRELTSGDAGITVPDIWNYSSRTLTYSPNNLLSVIGEDLSIIRGDTFEYTFEDLELTDYEKVYFTIKNNYQLEDNEGILQADDVNGLIILNGVKRSSGTGATITVSEGNGTVTVKIDASITKLLPYSAESYYYDLEIITPGPAGASGVTVEDVISTPVIGNVSIIRDVTKKIT